MNASPRTYRAPTTQAAFDLIQQELGPEALIVSVRQVPPAPWQAWKRPQVEVVAIANSTEPPGRLSTAPGQASKTRPRNTIPARSDKKELEAVLLKLLAQAQTPEQKRELPSPLLDLKNHLLRQELDDERVERLLMACAETLSPQTLQNQAALRQYAQRQLEADLRTFTPDLLNPPAPSQPWVLVLVGPSGSGKTSTCAKLAALASGVLHKQVAWVSADTVRTGAIALARAYTEPLGIPLHLAYTPDELVQATNAASADLILVDTPACNPRNSSQIVELGAFLTAIPKRVTLLTVPATLRESDALEAIAALSPFHLHGLVITKLDETRTFGNIFNLARRSQLPLAYFTRGNRPLGDLQAAQAAHLCAMLLGDSVR